MKDENPQTITSFNDIQLAELVDILKNVFNRAESYSKDVPDSYKSSLEGLIAALEYYRLVDDEIKQKDVSFKKLSLYENIKPTVIMAILRNSVDGSQKEKFEASFQMLKDYVEKRRAALTLEGSLFKR